MALLVAAALALRADAPQVPSRTWAPTGDLAHGRSGAAATLLPDGRVLVSGGLDQSEVTASAERYSAASATFLQTPVMQEARTGHTATLLLNGRVLVAGGLGAAGHALASIERYDPVVNAWIGGAGLHRARTGHTATLTADGYLILAGGEDAGIPTDSVELYEPLSGGVYAIDAPLSAPRSGHAAVTLGDGRMLIIGGSDGAHALSSVDIIDPYGGTITAGPPLATPRTGHTATMLLDGRVLVAGGSDGMTALTSAEIYDPATNTFAPAGGTLSAAREGHLAILLPHNNAVLIVGGAAAGEAVPSAELFVPWQGVRGRFFPTAPPSLGRIQAAGAALSFPADLTRRSGPHDGLILLAGGRAAPAATDPLRGAELYGFATVTTDKADYAPNRTVTISGAGWQPGETVSLVITEAGGPHRFGPFLAVADGAGRFQTDQFSTDLHDFELKFYLTATGSVSQAQTSFTDAQNATTTTLSCAPHAVTGLPLNVATTCTATVTDTGSPLNGPPTGTVAWNVATGPAKGTFNGDPCTLTAASASTSTCSVTYTPTNNKNGSIQAAYTSDTTANWANSSSAYSSYTVIAPDGSGTMTMTPTTVTAGTTGGTYSLTFRAASDGTVGYRAGSTATIQIPAGWTAPQSGAAGSPGYVSITGGNCPTRSISAISGTGPWIVTVDIVCGSNDTFILSYAGGGTAVTAPTAAGTYTFATQTQNEGGPLTDLAASPTVTVNPGAATQLGFTTAPGGGTGGTAWTAQPVVAVQDTYGNTVASSSASITLTIGTNPAGGALTCTANPKTAVSAVATFAGCRIDSAGVGYILAATASGLTAATSPPFDITVGPAAKLAATTSPSNSTGGTAFTTQPVITVQDAGGNTVTASSASVTLAIGTNPASGTLGGTATVAAVNGVAVFSGLSIDKAGTGYTLTAASAGLTGATTSAFNVTVGAAVKLAYTTAPGGGTGGTAWAAQPVVAVQDAGGNTVTGSSASVALTIGTNPGGGALTCTSNPVTAVAGVAAFASCRIDLAGAGYTLVASSPGLTSATSAPLTISVGPAARLTFTTSPGGATGGVALGIQPVVTVQDAGGNTVTSSTASIALAIGTNPSAGTLSGTATVAAISGVATFSGLSIDKAGAGYTLTAASTGLTAGTSGSFNITVGPAVKVGFTTSPGSAAAGAAFSPQPVVVVQDAGGNSVTTSSASITLTIGTNPGGGTLSGTATLSAVNGVATFSGLSIDRSGTGYTLTAASAGLSGGTSAAFNITFAAASRVVFTTAPGGGTGGLAWAAQPVVTVQDAFGNTVTISTASVTLAIGANPGSGTLGGTATLNAVGGVATFSGLSIDKVGTGYTLTAASAGLTGATSATFNVTLGPAAKVAFTTQPASSTGATAFPTQPVVTVQDAGGNTVTGSTASVTLAIGTNPGSGTLAGTATVTALAGVATFTGLSIDKAGTGYTLTAASAGLTGGTSSAFNITVGAAVKVAITTNPGSSTGGVAFAPQPVVAVQDAGGNTVTTSSASITLAIGTNPSAGTLAGTVTLSAVSGVATFSGLSINKAGTGYTLTATSTGLTGATTAAFNITVGPATQLAFTTQPGGGTGGTAWATQPVVTVMDAGGNTVTASSASITLAIASNPGGGSLSCTANPKAATSGVDTFAGCQIDLAGTGYTLSASSAGLTSATSSAFNVTVGAAVKLGFTTSPVSSVAGAGFGAVVAVQDAGGNTVTSSTALISLAIGTNPGSGTLSGTVAGVATGGVATFSGLSIDKVGTGYTLTAASTGLTAGASGSFNITFAAAAKVVFTTQPGGGTGGTAWPTQPAVTVQDAFGNIVTTSTASITLAIGTNLSGGTLTCTANPKAAVSGVATFAACRIDFSGTGYTLTAASAGLTGATSSTFNVTVGPAAKLAFSTSPSNSTGGVAFGTQPSVTVQDAGGNTVTTSSASITLAIGTNPSSGTLAGTKTINAASGVATFSGLSIDKAGTGYTLTAASTGLTGATSGAFNITVGPAAKLAVTTGPGNSVAGAAFGTSPAVTVLDAGGNTVTTSSVSITLAIGTNPGSGTLSGTATVSAVNGVATFSGLSIDKAGTGYTLTAASSGLTGATSGTFNITFAAASQLVFTTQPGGGTSGAAWTTQPVVTVLDAFGNTVTNSTVSITLAIASNPGGGTLTCTANPKAAASGVDAFAGCRISKGGLAYTLTASSAGLTSATSTSFNLNDATTTTFSCAPFPTTGVELNASTTCTATVADTGATFGPPTGTVAFARAGGAGTISGSPCTLAAATASTSACAFTFTPTSGTSGTLTATYSSDNATNWASSASAAGGYTVIATDGSGTETVNITTATAGATGLSFAFTFTTAADGTTGYASGAQLTLVIPAGWTAPQTSSSAGAGYISLSNNTGGGGNCSNGTTINNISGTGPWTITVDILCGTNRIFKINYAAVTAPTAPAAYSFDAQTKNANGTFASVASSPVVTVGAGAASKLAFTSAPGTSTAGAAFGTQPVVVVQDQYGNTVTGSSASITLAIQNNPGGGTLSCTANPKAATSGVASFAGCSINKTGAGYTLSASSTGLTAATSASFTITPAAATVLAFTTQPAGAVVGAAFTTQPVVTSQDAYGNNSTVGLPSSLTLTMTIATGGGALAGTTTIDIGTAAANGVAAFSTLEIDTAQTNTLQAAVSGGVLTAATSGAFAVARGVTVTTTSNATANYGASNVTLIALVTAGNAAVNEGTVTFTVKDGVGTVIGTPVTSAIVSGGNAAATFALGATAAGRYSIFTTYNPAVSSPNFNASSGAAGTLTLTTSVMRVSSGAYTGDGISGSQIQLLGFVPDVVIVKGDAAQEPVFWTSTMTGGQAKPMSSGGAAATNLVQASMINGFTVGTDARVNTNGGSYYWTAFGAATGGLVVGTYTGNGSGQSVNSLGFQPDLVIVAGAGATTPVFRTSAISGAVSLTTGSALTTRITSLDANGFTVGTDAAVNTSGVVYHYAAWTTATGKVAVGAYAGSAAARNITGLGFGPQAAIVKSYDCTTAGVEHSSALGPAADASLPFDASGGIATARITTLQSNGFGLGTNGAVNGSGCNYAWMAFAGDAPTAVRMKSSSATRFDSGTFVEWATGFEADNLGFHVYREEDGVRVRVSDGLIAGSGLLMGPGASASASQTYGWWDLKRARDSKATYWLEDVDLNGSRTWHGPIAPADGATREPANRAQSSLLKQLGKRAPRAVTRPMPAGGNTAVTTAAILTWESTSGATGYDLRFDTVSEPSATITGLSEPSYAPPAMAPATTYYWQVVAHYPDEEVTGPVWAFTTAVPAASLQDAVGAALPGSGGMTAVTMAVAVPNAGVRSQPAAVALAPAVPEQAAAGASAVAPAAGPAVTSRAPVAAAAPMMPAAEAVIAAPAAQESASIPPRDASQAPAAAGERGAVQSATATSRWIADPPAPRNVRVLAPGIPLEAAPGGAPAETPVLSPAATQAAVAGGPSVKLSVTADGWYRVLLADLAAAGLAVDAPLQLSLDGVEQPIETVTDGVGGAAIEFYGMAADTPYSNARVYWVKGGGGPVRRVKRLPSGLGGAPAAASFPFTIEKKDRTIYFAALLNGDADNFFGDLVTSEAVDEAIAVRHLDPSGSDAVLEVTLQGVTEAGADANHLVDVQVNGVRAGQLSFSGRQRGSQSFTLAASSLRDGDNTVTLTARGGDEDVSLVDVIRLTYPHTYGAEGDRLRLSAAGQQAVSVGGFSGAAIRVIDITDPAAALEVVPAVTAEPAGFRVSFQAPGSGRRTLLVFTDGNVLTPASTAGNAPSHWRDAANAADYLVLAPGAFHGAVAPLKALRESQGLAVSVVDLEDVYDEFSFGQKRPDAIREFLVQASRTWRRAPRFVVLVGNATTDPRNYLGTNEPDYLPTKLVTTAVLETASDDWFADADGDGIAELAMIGRLPAQSADQAAAMVNKIVAYERADAAAWSKSVALVADASAPGDRDFAGSSAQLQRGIPAGYAVSNIFRGPMGTGAARSALLSAINDGQALVDYAGHGSVDTWQDNLLTGADAPAFTNGARLPVFVMMDCLNGFFQGLFPEESLAEALIRTPSGGAVAVWASSGFTDPGNQAPLNAAFVRELFSGAGPTLGEAIAVAKRQASDPDVRRTWLLFGDPATRLKGRP